MVEIIYEVLIIYLNFDYGNLEYIKGYMFGSRIMMAK